ncbi:MAG TPA: putative methyltransferase [Candidatus Latescibacteria bacterium]|nr:putative methyltransferase [Candidatus Latescibacterota bacterium]
MTVGELYGRLKDKSKWFFMERDIGRLFSALRSSGDFWEVLDLSEVPMLLASWLVGELEREGFVAVVGEEVRLTEKGECFCRENDISRARRLECPWCRGKAVHVEAYMKVLREFKGLSLERPEPLRQYDQGYVTEESTVARVVLMAARGDLEGNAILVLGDDDLAGLALALTGAPKEVVVLDIDERLLDFIEDKAREVGFHNLEARRADFRDPLPEDLVGRFDVFLTDPSESLPALKAFIGRGVVGLKGLGGAGYFGLTRAESSLWKWRELEKILVEDFGMAITDIIHDFNAYLSWGYEREMKAWDYLPVKAEPKGIWYRSCWFRIERVEETHLENVPIEGEIVEDEEMATA